MAVKIKFDSAGNVIQPTLILATRSGKKLGYIPATNISVSDNFNSAFEMEFKVSKYNNGTEYEYWDKLKDFKLVWCREWDVWFEIYVTVSDESGLIKDVQCVSLPEAELSQINLYNIEINTEDDIARDDYVVTVLYDETNTEGSLLHRISEKIPHYTIEYVEPRVASIQRTFTFDDISIYDAMQEIAEEIDCIFIFDAGSDSDGMPARTIRVYDLESYCSDCGTRNSELSDTCSKCGGSNLVDGYGEDTTIFISRENLADSITFDTDTDSVKNCFRLVAGDDLMTATIINCNPNGSQYLWYFSDETKEDMSDELVSALSSYDELYDYYYNDYEINLSSDLLTSYNELIEKYQSYNSDLTALDFTITGYPALMTAYYDTIDFYLYLNDTMMPSVDTASTDAATEAAKITAEAISPVAVSDLDTCSGSTASSAVLAMAKIIVNGNFQVKVNSYSYDEDSFEWTGNFTVTNYSDDEDTATSDTITVTITGDLDTYILQCINKVLDELDDDDEGTDISSLFDLDISYTIDDDTDDITDISGAFVEKIKEYCLSSLNSFYDAVESCLSILIDQGTADKETWASQDPDLYTELYEPWYVKKLALAAEIQVREDEIEIVTGVYDTDGNLEEDGIQTLIDAEKTAIQDALDLEDYLGEDLLNELMMYRREDTYQNSNYISDGLDNAELFANALEFIEVAENEIYKSATLQHSITSTLHNLLTMHEFEPLVDYFEVGNWLRIKVDETVYKLRLLSYTIDFDSLDNISVEFSDVKEYASGVSDTESILNQASSMATSYSSVSRQASQGSSSKAVIDEWNSIGLDITNTNIINAADGQTQSWDSTGLLLRQYDSFAGEYSDEQMKIINSTIAITDDDWRTIRTAIGRFYYIDPSTGDLMSAYGINAEVLVGSLILGEELGIYSSNGSLTFDENGLVIDTSSGYAFTITNGDNVQFYIDSDGNVVLDNGATITWGNIDLTELFLSSSNILLVDSDGETVTDEDGNVYDLYSYLSTKYATIEYLTTYSIDAVYGVIENLTAYTLDAENFTAENADITEAYIEKLKALSADINTLIAGSATIASLEAEIADINTLFADYATIEYLTTNYLNSNYITTNYLDATTIQSTYATIADLEAVTADVTSLNADIATITTLLAGGVATDELTAIHLTSENVVIDDAVITDAMIASLSASKITSGSIYTSLVTIQTAEDDTTLYIDNSLLQIADEDSNIRIQLGLDGEGNYNYYVFDADGNILFDALGIYGEGIHDGVIINDHVASKTSTYTGISGDKLDIDSVITSINEDGSVTIDANSVTIDGETLDYKLTTIEASANSSLSDYIAYYALSTSSTEAPDFYDVAPALADTAIVDESMADYTSLSSNWSTEYVAATDGYYTWRVYVLESTDGTLTIGEAALITGDAVARASTETLTTELSVVQGQIEALVAFTAIEDWYDGTTTIYDMYSSITVELESITSTVSSLETTVNGSDEITGLVSKVSTLEQTSSEISASVSSLEESVDSINSEIGDEDTESTIVYDIAQLKVSVSKILLSIESLDVVSTSDYEELVSQVSSLSITVDSIDMSVSSLDSYVTSGFSSIEEQIAALTLTSDSIIASVSSVTSQIENSLTDYVVYYALSESSETAPDLFTVTPALTDTAIVDESTADGTDLSTNWSTSYPAIQDGYYIWQVYVYTTTSGVVTYGEPSLITGDAIARAKTSEISSTLEVAQEYIDLLVEYTELTSWQNDSTTIYEAFSNLNVSLESITSTVNNLTTIVNGDDDTIGLVSQIATLTETAESIDARVESLEVTVGDDESGLVADVAALTITANTIQSSVSSLSTDYSTLSASVTTVTQTAESLTVSIDSLSSLLTLSNSTIKLSSILTLIEQQYTTNRVLFETTLNDYNVLTSQISDSDGENIDDILDILYNEYIELEDTYYKVYGSDESLSDLDYQIYYAYSATSVGDVNDFDNLTWSVTTLDELTQMYAYADYALVDSSAVSDYYVYYYLEITQDDGTVTQSVYSLFTGEIEYLSYYDVLYDTIVNAVNADDEDALDEALADYESAWANYVTYESLLESYFSILQTDLLSYSSSNSITVSENSVQAYADDLVGEYADALEALQTQFDSYFIFDNNGLTIGATTSSDEDEYKMVLRNNGLYLECNDEVTAYIASNNNTSYLYIVNANVENSLMIGGFSYVPRFNYTLVDSAVVDTDVVGSTNGGMSIVWSG